MKPVFQVPMDGQCMRASICSIFELPIEKGPKVQCEGHVYDNEAKEFICTIPEHKYKSYTDDKGVDHFRFHCDSATEQDRWVNEWAAQFGLAFSYMYLGYGEREGGGPRGDGVKIPPGLCIASGRSPRFSGNHAVVWDTRLTDFEHPLGRMVHDPNPAPEGERPGLLSLEKFEYFEVVDPSLLWKLAELRNA